MDSKNKHNIVNALMLATQDELKQGKMWYLDTRNICKQIAKDTNTKFIVVAGIFSALSVTCPISKNILDTKMLILNSDHKCTTYKQQKEKALRILSLYKPTVKKITGILNGQKTVRFFLNIYSRKYDVVTIDRHAISLYFGTFNHRFIETKPRMKKIREDYKDVASTFNLRPYQLQAITWLVWKRINNI